jgi:hypothetical protein
MGECDIFERDGVGEAYGTREARSILNREDALLGDEERVLKGRLLEFEQHFLSCDVCLAKVQEHQELRAAFRRLGEKAVGAPAGGSVPRSPSRWLAAAASVLLVSSVALAVWVGLLSHRAGRLAGPRAVAGVYELEPVSPSQRAAGAGTTVPALESSFVLAVAVSRSEIATRRYEVRIADGQGRELFRDEDVPVDPSGKLYVQVGPGFLAPGDHTLEVRAFRRASGEALAEATFPFRVEGSEAGR